MGIRFWLYNDDDNYNDNNNNNNNNNNDNNNNDKNNNVSKNNNYNNNNSNNKDKFYIGSTGGHFKDRYTGHKYTFKHINKKHSTRLSDFVWQYFDRYGTKPEMEWSILHHANNNISGASKICQICNLERMAILAEDSNQLLNKRRDISNNCVHNRRFFFK